MIARFCAYTTLRNLRPFEPFYILFLLYDLNLSFAMMGAIIGYERFVTGALEVPLGALSDRFGRRRTLIASSFAATLAMLAFGFATAQPAPVVWIFAAETLFGISEALRTGTHKGLMLDWLDRQGRGDEAARVIALTRFFSKTSAGTAALIGGILVAATGGFAGLFFATAIATTAGMILAFSYPRELEGEWQRPAEAEKRRALPWRERWRLPFGKPGLVALLVASVLFESQTKLALHYLQPYLKLSLDDWQMPVTGAVGAIIVGVYFLVQGALAGVASFGGAALSERIGERATLLAAIATGAVILSAATIGLLTNVWWLGLVVLIGLAALQNARRPVFVAALNRVMDKFYRTTTISVESQARSWIYAATAIGFGALADVHGLTVAFAGMTALVAVAWGIQWLAPNLSPTSTAPAPESAEPEIERA